MPTEQPEHTGQANQQNRASVCNEDDIDEILRDTEAYDGHYERESNDDDDHQAARPPGTETGEKAQECAKRLVGPNINGAFTWEHKAKLPGNNSTRNEEGEESQDPIDIGGCTSNRYNASIRNKEDDCDEDGDHVKGVQNFGENASRDAFRTQDFAATTLSSCCH